MALIQSCDHLLSLGASNAPDGQPLVVSPRRKDPSHATGDNASELGSVHDSYFGSSPESLEMEEEEDVPNLLETTVDSVTEGPPLLPATDVDEEDQEVRERGEGGTRDGVG